MPRRRKRTAKSLSRFSSYNPDKNAIYPPTNQRLFFSAQLYTVYRETLERHKKFIPDAALRVVSDHRRKKQAQCVGHLLDDKMILERCPGSSEPFRKSVLYSEIEDFRRDPVHRNFFVLSIQAADNDEKYYEVYYCKSREDIGRYEYLITRALENPNYILVDEDEDFTAVFLTETEDKFEDPIQPTKAPSSETRTDTNVGRSIYTVNVETTSSSSSSEDKPTDQNDQASGTPNALTIVYAKPKSHSLVRDVRRRNVSERIPKSTIASSNPNVFMDLTTKPVDETKGSASSDDQNNQGDRTSKYPLYIKPTR
ncbi:unnamed protein product [Calicophoron daubneyi]|uniref:Trematode PH-like domain-containing protein n=1 Tax=Calicophoron daubneyi TaxID=300641 RepID=A0AAV2TGU0_CALDB